MGAKWRRRTPVHRVVRVKEVRRRRARGWAATRVKMRVQARNWYRNAIVELIFLVGKKRICKKKVKMVKVVKRELFLVNGYCTSGQYWSRCRSVALMGGAERPRNRVKCGLSTGAAGDGEKR